MSLIKSKSKKAFEHNVEAEMSAGKPQKQSLAIAFDIKRKNKRKKMAAGGEVEHAITVKPDKGFGKIIMIDQHEKDMMAEGGAVSASNERRPMPDNEYNDSAMAKANDNKKAIKDGDWTDNPTMKQAQSNNGRKVLPIKHPRMVASSVLNTRLRDQEDDLMSSASPGPYNEEPPKADDEKGPDRQGPSVPSLKMKKMAEGGMLKKNEADLMASESPSEDEGAAEARSLDEEGQDRQGPKVSDMEREHSNGRMPYAKGGIAHEMDEQPMEEEMEHHDSIAAAIMAKRDRRAAQMSDSDIDEMERLYNGGEIHSHDSIYSDDSDMADLSRNADEDANEEDQVSFNALRKENYSESEGLDELDQPMDSNEHGHDIESDKHDMIDAIRRKIVSKRQR